MVVVLLSHFMLFTLLNIVIPVVALTGVGFLMGRRHSARPDMAFINHANVTVFCPALVFSALMANPVSVGEGWPLIAAAILIVVVPGLVLYWLTPAGMTREAFLVTGMFRNTGNVGIPLMVLAYGNDMLGDIVLLFVLSNLLHFSLGLFILSRGGSSWLWLRNPNIWAAVLGVICAPYAHLFPGFVLTSLEMLGQVVIPLMLFALGVRLAEGRITQVMTAELPTDRTVQHGCSDGGQRRIVWQYIGRTDGTDHCVANTCLGLNCWPPLRVGQHCGHKAGVREGASKGHD